MGNYFTLKEIMLRRAERLKRLIAEKEGSLKSAPEGNLRISHSNKRVQYYNKRKYIKDRQFAEALAQKQYDMKVLEACQNELKQIESFLKEGPGIRAEEIYGTLREERQKLVTPIIETDEEFVRKWKSVEFTPGRFDENDTTDYRTDLEERVRSKSEMLIANHLIKRGIPYRYECPVILKGYGKVYTDFTVLNVRLRKEYLYEHLGMLGDEGYGNDTVRKINSYMNSGYFLGDTLIISVESDRHPLSIKNIDLLIDRYFI